MSSIYHSVILNAIWNNNRLVLIQQMMFDSLMELESELKDLRERLIQTRDDERLQEEKKHFIEEEEKSL